MLAALLGSFAGAWAVTGVDASALRRALPLVLLAILAYTLARKDLGRHHAPRFAGAAQALPACTIGMVVGFYDGFFGPGTGTLLIVGFMWLLAEAPADASANAKVVNFASNVGSLVVFASAVNLKPNDPSMRATLSTHGLDGSPTAAARGPVGFEALLRGPNFDALEHFVPLLRRLAHPASTHPVP